MHWPKGPQPHWLSHTLICSPQRPQGCDCSSPGLQPAFSSQVSQSDHTQPFKHVRSWAPHTPQPCCWVTPGEHASGGPKHSDHSFHWHWLPHVRTCVPQLPHSVDSSAPGSHTPSASQMSLPTHAPLGLQVSSEKPHWPQATVRVSPGSHSPQPSSVSPLQSLSMASSHSSVSSTGGALHSPQVPLLHGRLPRWQPTKHGCRSPSEHSPPMQVKSTQVDSHG
jgi:hypothetical protein